jgi:ribosome-interacting GTPase 1
MSVLQKIKDIEDEMARTQRNKATSFHLGTLKAKLAKLRRELLTPGGKGGSGGGGGGGAGEGFDVAKAGDSRVGLIGFPSVGKVRESERAREHETHTHTRATTTRH